MWFLLYVFCFSFHSPHLSSSLSPLCVLSFPLLLFGHTNIIHLNVRFNNPTNNDSEAQLSSVLYHRHTHTHTHTKAYVCLWQNGKHAVNLALWNEARRINAEKWWKVAALSGENYHNSSNISTNINSNTNNNISNNSTNNNSSTNNISNSWKMRRRPWCLVSCENAPSSNWEIVQMCQNRRKWQDVICSSIGLWWVVSHRWHTLRATNLSTRTMPDKYWNNDCWPPIQQRDIWLWLLNFTQRCKSFYTLRPSLKMGILTLSKCM